MSVIGIDLGTTYSCVAICNGKQVNIIRNDIGKNTTPSHISFENDDLVVIGEAAKTRVDIVPENCIFDVKRLIGRKFDDPVVQNDIKTWPFKVIEGPNNNPAIQLVSGKTFVPEQISAKILTYLKKTAEEFLACPVTQAVITVPAYFNDGQRQATKDAGAIAGLEVLRIINEPTAAALAYSFQRKSQEPKTVLVFDLGGGTFDICILKSHGENIEVIGVGGDSHLGGEDLDRNLMQYCLDEFKKTDGLDLSEGNNSSSEDQRKKPNKILRRLKYACELSKIHLSSGKSANVTLDAVHGTKDLNIKVTRAQFITINKKIIDKCMEIMENVINEVNLTKEQIDEIILVGGSSKIPEIKTRIENYFGKKPLETIKGDEAVAYGAAIQAKISSPKDQSTFTGPNIQIRDVYPLHVGIEVAGKSGESKFSRIIKKNTPIPHKQKQHYLTVFDKQSTVTINIYESEDCKMDGAYHLGTFEITDLPQNCPMNEPIDVTMEINAEGILHCTAICPRNSVSSKLQVEETKGRLTNEEKLRMTKEEMETGAESPC